MKRRCFPSRRRPNWRVFRARSFYARPGGSACPQFNTRRRNSRRNSGVTKDWVVNASPLILLGKADQLYWLPELGNVVIPRSVENEIASGPSHDPARVWIEGKGMEFVRDEAPASAELLAWNLGKGETSVISWAIANRGYEAVLDDAAARRCASAFDISMRGTLSLVALAKRRGLVAECRGMSPDFRETHRIGIIRQPIHYRSGGVVRRRVGRFVFCRSRLLTPSPARCGGRAGWVFRVDGRRAGRPIARPRGSSGRSNSTARRCLWQLSVGPG